MAKPTAELRRKLEARVKAIESPQESRALSAAESSFFPTAAMPTVKSAPTLVLSTNRSVTIEFTPADAGGAPLASEELNARAGLREAVTAAVFHTQYYRSGLASFLSSWQNAQSASSVDEHVLLGPVTSAEVCPALHSISTALTSQNSFTLSGLEPSYGYCVRVIPGLLSVTTNADGSKAASVSWGAPSPASEYLYTLSDAAEADRLRAAREREERALARAKESETAYLARTRAREEVKQDARSRQERAKADAIAKLHEKEAALDEATQQVAQLQAQVAELSKALEAARLSANSVSVTSLQEALVAAEAAQEEAQHQLSEAAAASDAADEAVGVSTEDEDAAAKAGGGGEGAAAAQAEESADGASTAPAPTSSAPDAATPGVFSSLTSWLWTSPAPAQAAAT